MLRGYEERIKGGEISLGDLATSESDCSSARKKGDLYVVFLVSPLLFSRSETVVCRIGRADNFADCDSQGDSLGTGTCRRSLSRRLLLSSPERSVGLSIRLAGCI